MIHPNVMHSFNKGLIMKGRKGFKGYQDRGQSQWIQPEFDVINDTSRNGLGAAKTSSVLKLYECW